MTLSRRRDRPLMIDLYAGLGGWAQGGIAEGYFVVGFDIERHDYGTGGYLAQLVLQDVLTLHGSQFKDAALIVASPPCQEFSYMAMPWSKAKAKERDLLEGRDDPKRLTALFDACFRIQREAIDIASTPEEAHRLHYRLPVDGQKVPGFRFDGSGKSFQTASVEGQKIPKGESSISRMHGSKSPARKAASALIAKIPLPLARYIAATHKP